MKRVHLIASVLTGCLVLAACAGPAAPSSPLAALAAAPVPVVSPSAAAADEFVAPATPTLTCLQEGEQERVLRTDPSLAAVQLGASHLGVVVAAGEQAGLCPTLAFARTLAATGYQVMVVAMGARGLDALAAAVATLTGAGATALVLVGVDTGATAALVLAARMFPPPAGVIALSARVVAGDLDAGAAMPAVTGQVVFLTSTDQAEIAAATTLQAPVLDRSDLLSVPAETGLGLLADVRARELITATLAKLLPLAPIP